MNIELSAHPENVGAGAGKAAERELSRRKQRIATMLAPRAVAIVGASDKESSVGRGVQQVLKGGGFDGKVFLVNPRYSEIDGEACYPTLSALPEVPDLAVLAVGASRIEAVVREAIDIGVSGLSIFDGCLLPDDLDPPLVERLRRLAAEAELPICGGNGMGFYNFDARVMASYAAPSPRKAGPISLIAHSGSAFLELLQNDNRYRFNIAVSSGQEINCTAADYIEYALDLPSTRVIALFLESAREPEDFVKALRRAKAKGVPIVVLKVGRSAKGAALAATHSGAMAGNSAAYEAVFDRFGVLQVSTLDELMATAMLLSIERRPALGGIAVVSDSGGLRELFVDMAESADLPLAHFAEATTERLRLRLPMGLSPENPVDAGGALGPDYAATFKDCITYLADDPHTALIALEFVANDAGTYAPELLEVATEIPRHTDKPLIMYSSYGATANAGLGEKLLDAGVPLITGVGNLIVASRNALAYRDFQARRAEPESPRSLVQHQRWVDLLTEKHLLSEAESLAFLADFAIPVVQTVAFASESELLAKAQSLTFPVVLKTAEPGISHKSDIGGVVLNIPDVASLHAAYRDMAGRLGSVVIVEPMLQAGIEIHAGAVVDPQFGPMVMVGAGGILVEAMNDRQVGLAPLARADARRMIQRLKMAPLLSGYRGLPAADLDVLSGILVNLAMAVSTFGSFKLEIDINPLVVTRNGIVAVDAVVAVQRQLS